MKMLPGFPVALAASLPACTTPGSAGDESAKSQSHTAPIVVKGVVWEYAVSTVTTCSATRAYELLLYPSDAPWHIAAGLFIKDRSTPGSEVPYQEIWEFGAALGFGTSPFSGSRA
jgi:hypothetical protein